MQPIPRQMYWDFGYLKSNDSTETIIGESVEVNYNNYGALPWSGIPQPVPPHRCSNTLDCRNYWSL